MCGTDADYKAESDKRKNPEEAGEAAEKALEEILANLPKSGADEAANVLSSVSNIISSVTTSTIIRTETTINGIMSYHSDGTTTFTNNDGTVIITKTDGSTVTINTDGTTTINTATT
jgi:hypothetical protein